MAILAVGGSPACFRVRQPDDITSRGNGFSGTPLPRDIYHDLPELTSIPPSNDIVSGWPDKFRYFLLGAPGYFIDLPEQGTRTVWMHFEVVWSIHQGAGGNAGFYDVDDPGIVFMRDNIAVARLKLYAGAPYVFQVQTTPDGYTTWENRGDAIPFKEGRYDIGFNFSATGGSMDVYYNDVLVSSHRGAMYTPYTAVNRIMFYANYHAYGQIIVADEPTVGMALVPDSTGAEVGGSISNQATAWTLSDYALTSATRPGQHDFNPEVFAYTQKVNDKTVYSHESLVPEAGAVDTWPAGTRIDQSLYDIMAIVVAGNMVNYGKTPIVDARFMLTDNRTRMARSPRLGMHPQDWYGANRVQYVWNNSPFTGGRWVFDEIPGLCTGVETV